MECSLEQNCFLPVFFAKVTFVVLKFSIFLKNSNFFNVHKILFCKNGGKKTPYCFLPQSWIHHCSHSVTSPKHKRVSPDMHCTHIIKQMCWQILFYIEFCKKKISELQLIALIIAHFFSRNFLSFPLGYGHFFFFSSDPWRGMLMFFKKIQNIVFSFFLKNCQKVVLWNKGKLKIKVDCVFFLQQKTCFFKICFFLKKQKTCNQGYKILPNISRTHCFVVEPKWSVSQRRNLFPKGFSANKDTNG